MEESPQLISEKELKCIDFGLECYVEGADYNETRKMRETIDYLCDSLVSLMTKPTHADQTQKYWEAVKQIKGPKYDMANT